MLGMARLGLRSGKIGDGGGGDDSVERCRGCKAWN